MTVIDARIMSDLQALIRSAKTPLIEAEPGPRPPSFAVGQKLDVRVVAILPDGRAEVVAGDQRLNLSLPERLGVGSGLSLTVTATSPRLQFTLSAPLAVAAQTATLSDAGQLLTALREALAPSGSKAAVGPPFQATPLSPTPPNSGQELAAPLRQAIVLSGYFYEAHQEQWVAGARSLGALKLEPHNRPTMEPAAMTEKGAQDSPAAAAMALTEAETGQTSQSTTAATSLDRFAAAHTHSVVTQQLNMLDGQPIVWQGEVWPGQKMRWEIETEKRSLKARDDSPSWRTTVEIDLPRLGVVQATLSLSASTVSLRIDAAPDAIVELAAAQGDLGHRMAAAGLALMAPTLKERG